MREFSLPVMSMDPEKNLYIGGEYMLKSEGCYCGAEWTHVAFWRSGGWLQACANCAAVAKWTVHRRIIVLSKATVFSIASARVKPSRRVVQKKESWRTQFWKNEVMPWVCSQSEPVTPETVAEKFNRKPANAGAMLRKFEREGYLMSVVIDSTYNRKAFLPKERS